MSKIILPEVRQNRSIRREYIAAWRAYRVTRYAIIGGMPIKAFSERHHVIHREVSRSHGVSPEMAQLVYQAEERDQRAEWARAKRTRQFRELVEARRK
jgi:hypothetical protein